MYGVELKDNTMGEGGEAQGAWRGELKCAVLTKQVGSGGGLGGRTGELGLAELTVFRVQLSVWKVLCREL